MPLYTGPLQLPCRSPLDTGKSPRSSPSVPQTEQPQLSQSFTESENFLIGEHLQPSDCLHSPPLHSPQQLPVLLVLGPQGWVQHSVGSQESRGAESPPSPAAHTALVAAQSMDGSLGCKSTLLSYVQNPPGLSSRKSDSSD